MKKQFVSLAHSTSLLAWLPALALLSACSIFEDERTGTEVFGERHAPILNQQYLRAPAMAGAPRPAAAGAPTPYDSYTANGAAKPYNAYAPEVPAGKPGASTPFDSYDEEGNYVGKQDDDSSVGVADSVIGWFSGPDDEQPAAKSHNAPNGAYISQQQQNNNTGSNRKPLRGNVPTDSGVSATSTGSGSASNGGYYSEPQYIAMPLGTPPVPEPGSKPVATNSAPVMMESAPVTSISQQNSAEPMPSLTPLANKQAHVQPAFGDSPASTSAYVDAPTPVTAAESTHSGEAVFVAPAPVTAAVAAPDMRAPQANMYNEPMEGSEEDAYRAAIADDGAQPTAKVERLPVPREQPGFFDRVFGSYDDEEMAPPPAIAPKRAVAPSAAVQSEQPYPTLASVPQKTKSFNDILNERNSRLQGMEQSRDAAAQEQQSLQNEPSELMAVQPAPAEPVQLSEPAPARKAASTADDEPATDLPAASSLQNTKATRSSYTY